MSSGPPEHAGLSTVTPDCAQSAMGHECKSGRGTAGPLSEHWHSPLNLGQCPQRAATLDPYLSQLLLPVSMGVPCLIASCLLLAFQPPDFPVVDPIPLQAPHPAPDLVSHVITG